MELALLLILMAAVVSLDTTAGPQLLVSEPMVSCALLGLLFGEPRLGLALGLFFQLLWLGYLPLGAGQFTDSTLGAYIGCAALLIAGRWYGLTDAMLFAALPAALVIGIVAGVIGMRTRTLERKLNGWRSVLFVARLDRGETPSILVTHITGLGLAALRGVFSVLVLVPVGALVCGLVRFLPSAILASAPIATGIVAGVVAAPTVLFYRDRGLRRLIPVGAASGCLWLAVHL